MRSQNKLPRILFIHVTYILSLKFSSSYILNKKTSTRYSHVVFEHKHEVREFMHSEVPTTINEQENNRYKNRSILLQHILTKQTKQYKKLQNRLLLLQDTVQKLVRERREKILEPNPSVINTRYLEDLEVELKKKEELNQLLQQKCDNLLLIQEKYNRRDEDRLKALKVLSDQLQYELSLFSTEHINGLFEYDTFRNKEIIVHDTSSSFEEENWERDLGEWNRIIQKMQFNVSIISLERERMFSNWEKERDQMALDLSLEKIKVKQALQEACQAQQELLSSLETSPKGTLVDDNEFTRDLIEIEHRFHEESVNYSDGEEDRTSFFNISNKLLPAIRCFKSLAARYRRR